MHGLAAPAFTAYFVSGAFLSAVFENWESEFLQMSVYVLLTALLFQKGSPESRSPDEAPEEEGITRPATDPRAPWPARGGLTVRYLYAHSLTLALALLFVISFVLHWINSARAAGEKAVEHGLPPPSLFSYLFSAELWFESFQNWQSEFLSTAVLVLLAIFLRQRNSPESKRVAAPVSQTGA
ncbi:MAG: DUF6766 family protein, partial [Parvibaculaceae bacterium]